MIKYIDTFSANSFHVQINACILKMLMLLYPNNVEYYSSASNRKEVLNLVPEVKHIIKWRKISVYSGFSKYSILLHYLISALQNVRLLLFSQQNQLLVFNYNNPFSIRIVNCLNKLLKRKILIICHGELELLFPHRDAGILAKLVSVFVRDFFRKSKGVDANITFCVLGESILKNLREVLSCNMIKQFRAIEHPYIYLNQDVRRNENLDENVLNLGVVGSFSFAKGGRNFIQLVENFCNCSDIHFSVTGSVLEGGEDLKRLGVSLPQNGGVDQIPIEEFSNRISILDYIIFMYPSDSYKLTASGAIMDAIKWGVPIISIKNDYFESIFMKYGEFGFFVDNISEMKDLILSLRKTHTHPDFDFSSIRKKSSPESISIQLKEILDNICC